MLVACKCQVEAVPVCAEHPTPTPRPPHDCTKQTNEHSYIKDRRLGPLGGQGVGDPDELVRRLDRRDAGAPPDDHVRHADARLERLPGRAGGHPADALYEGGAVHLPDPVALHAEHLHVVPRIRVGNAHRGR